MLAIDPSFEHALLDLAYLYEATNRPKAAEEVYLRLLTFDSKQVQAHTRLGTCSCVRGTLIGLCSTSTNCSATTAKMWKVASKSASIHLQQKNYEDAIQDFTFLLKDEPQYDKLFTILDHYEEKGESEQAIVNLRLISRTSPVWTAAQIRLALIFSKMKDYRAGQEVLQEAIAKQPDFPDLYLYFGLLYEEEKNLDEAIKIVDRGIERRAPQEPELLFRKGVLLDKKGDKNAAIEVMRKILETDSKNANALNYIG